MLLKKEFIFFAFAHRHIKYSNKKKIIFCDDEGVPKNLRLSSQDVHWTQQIQTFMKTNKQHVLN